MIKFLLSLLSFSVALVLLPGAEAAVDEIAKRNREVVLYGTDSEILDLIKQLSDAGDSSLDPALANLLAPNANVMILENVLEYFTSKIQKERREADARLLLSGEAEGALNPDPERAHLLNVDLFCLEVLEYWDQYRNSVIEGAMSYLAARRDRRASPFLFKLLEDGSDQLNTRAISALGTIGGEGVAEKLISWLEEKNPGNNLEHDVYRALGQTKDRAASPFIKERLSDEYLAPSTKIALLQASSSIGDPDLLPVLLNLLSDSDANVRSSLIEALAPFEGERVDEAILAGFRDSFYKTRIAAAKASGERLYMEAVPFLIFRAERDSVAAVQIQALEALAKFKTPEALECLRTILKDERRSDAARRVSAQGLLDAQIGRAHV